MEINIERMDGVLVAKAWSRIDGGNARDFEKALKAAIGESDRAVVIDFEALSYISSAGLRALLVIAKKLQNRDAAFAICSLTDTVQAVFEISGFDKIISIHSSTAEALAAVGGSDAGSAA